MSDQISSGDEAPDMARAASDTRLMRSLLIGIFLFALVYALYFARDFFMPVILAFMLALMLTPIVRLLRRHGVPEVVSATMLVFLSVAVVGAIGYFMSGPVIALANDWPSIMRKLSERLTELRHPFERLLEILNQVDRVAETAQEPGLQKVVVAQPGIVSQAAGNLLSGATTVAVTFVLSLFLLASGTLFYEKIVQSFARMSEKKRALRVVYDVEREISRYLLTVTLINAGLGLAVGLGMWAIGMPTPLVWGVAAMLLNFLPYIGAATTILLVAAISIITFDSLSYALLAPGFVVLCNVIEGQLVTPLVVGRRLEINAVAIFIAVAFWSWLWGFVGALIAVPILVVIKVFCDHFDSLRHVGNFLAAQQTFEEAVEDAAEAKRPS
ncbi:AI-2E family transporter [Mesorhizobium sp. LHD-90]|uniref:AI-2E family transporter n=1 Tax=Mesorhizobium sp. LHD-90 TaxID=3071414 RepID=UPI0027DFB751|nr:AI-2E family transporter [Mesorhizobium sp. LHD-90]MDQ6435720.1 AI-2E family transporter [Mesorhizobium sp. LHD-90]